MSFSTDPKPMGSYPPTGIDVLIVGTGLAGLTAAIECTRKGHSVRVLERNRGISTEGDMYFMGLSATRFFKHWPYMGKEYDRISLHNAWIETYKHDGTPMVPPLKVSDRLRDSGLDPDTPPGTFQMRPLVYKMLMAQVERLRVDVQFGRRVVEYFEDAERQRAGVVTAGGERIEADVVFAADGVGSKSHGLVGGQVRAVSSGRAMWRAAFPRSHLDKDPDVKEFFGMVDGETGEEPIIRTWLAPGAYGLTLTRPDAIVWTINHDVTGTERESWRNTIESPEVLSNIDKNVGPAPWAPLFKRLIALTPPKTITDLDLVWRDPKPNWSSPGGRVVQIGDAAHSYLPASGNGATQAIEDAISLASCLQLGAESQGNNTIPQSVRAHVRLRFVRNACAQKLGFANAELLQDTDWGKVKLDPRRAQPRLPLWVSSHDSERYAHENYGKVVESMNRGIPFDQDDGIPPNYPPGYKYEPWSIEQIMQSIRQGKPVDLGSGDWR